MAGRSTSMPSAAEDQMPPMPTWEQVVAMQRESAALRAQVAAHAHLELPSASSSRARRLLPSRNEYPVFTPSHKDISYPPGNHIQNLAESGIMHSFRARVEEGRHTGGYLTDEIVAVEPSRSMPRVERNGRSRSPITPISHHGLSPKFPMLNGSATNLPAVSPTLIGLSGQLPVSESLGRKRVQPPGPNLKADSALAELATEIASRRKESLHSAAVNAAPHQQSSSSSWKGCTGSLAMVAPSGDAASATGSGMHSPNVSRQPAAQETSDRPGATLSGGFSGLFPWNKKKVAGNSIAHESRNHNSDREGSRSLESVIRNLEHRLELEQRKREGEVRELQLALGGMEDRCKNLQFHCQDLELQMSTSASTRQRQSRQRARHVKYTRNTTPRGEELENLGSSSGDQHNDEWAGVQKSVPLDLTPNVFFRTFDDAVVSMKKLIRAICHHIRQMGGSSSQVITDLLENHKFGGGRLPKAVKNLCFESFLNQILFENFENVSFDSNGPTLTLDPDALRRESYQSFHDLKRVRWSDIEPTLVDDQAVIVNPTFHEFFVLRMETVLRRLGLDPGDTAAVISAFFDAIKAVWLVHLLAFSFRPLATIFRIKHGVAFDPKYMEHVVLSEKQPRGTTVALMVNPGFFLDNWIVKSKVLCSD